MKTILLFGKNGQIGSALQTVLRTRGAVVALDRTTCDLSDVDQLRSVIGSVKPDIIVNAAAYTAVDRAESDKDLCFRVNSLAPAVMAEAASRLNAVLVHYSTDYVFSGDKPSAYLEDDRPDPLNAYGRSKLDGDQAVLASGCRSIILRVGWVYSAAGQNFANTILQLARKQDRITVVADQFGAPTSARFIADTTANLIDQINLDKPQRFGVFHLAAAGRASWHGYATELLREARRLNFGLGAGPDDVVPISSTEYATVAPRPRNSMLDTGKIQRVFSVRMPDWQVGVRQLVQELSKELT
ncbi:MULTISPECIES: dTDP-4-dehydrorhamnose reductase [unclassified Afipia]|uniref:dTDP-4-dehydrorhamnose reductase n=1 Tax=unclassified Afipia TaxID=2642050 RepID=UPI0004093F94|nr:MULTISPECIES: dTDP-4-dehydrorhamnose reductase [unclassified Afipia]